MLSLLISQFDVTAVAFLSELWYVPGALLYYFVGDSSLAFVLARICYQMWDSSILSFIKGNQDAAHVDTTCKTVANLKSDSLTNVEGESDPSMTTFESTRSDQLRLQMSNRLFRFRSLNELTQEALN